MALSFSTRPGIMEKPQLPLERVQADSFTEDGKTFDPQVVFLKDNGKQKRIEGNKACAEMQQQASVSTAQLPAIHLAEATEAQGGPDLDRMMDSYGTSLLRLCFMYLKDSQLAEDAVQETFIKVYRYWDRFDGSANEKTWINRIAVNVCKDMLRSAWNRRVNVVETLAEVPDERDHTLKVDDTLLKAVMALKPKYKEVILLYYYEDMKISEIATALGAPESTVSVRLKRAREALGKRLGEWYYG